MGQMFRPATFSSTTTGDESLLVVQRRGFVALSSLQCPQVLKLNLIRSDPIRNLLSTGPDLCPLVLFSSEKTTLRQSPLTYQALMIACFVSMRARRCSPFRGPETVLL
jgi:hypothetical protein